MDFDKSELIRIKEWLTSDCVDDPEELFNMGDLIVGLIDFYLENSNLKPSR